MFASCPNSEMPASLDDKIRAERFLDETGDADELID
jgi:hypothetical protein